MAEADKQPTVNQPFEFGNLEVNISKKGDSNGLVHLRFS